MPRFKEMERAHRSIILSMVSEQRRRARNREAGSGARWSLFVTLAGGMQELVDRIVSLLPEGCVRSNTPIARLSRDTDKNLWKVTTGGNESLEVDAVVLATPSSQSAAILGGVACDAADALKQITSASTATVSLAFRQKDFPRRLDSFGFVVPAIESRNIMACTFSSLKYPGRAPEGHVLLRAFVGGSLQPRLFHDDDATMEKHVRGELASLLGVIAQPPFLTGLAPSELHASVSRRTSIAYSANRSGTRKIPWPRSRRQCLSWRRYCRLRAHRRRGSGESHQARSQGVLKTPFGVLRPCSESALSLSK